MFCTRKSVNVIPIGRPESYSWVFGFFLICSIWTWSSECSPSADLSQTNFGHFSDLARFSNTFSPLWTIFFCTLSASKGFPGSRTAPARVLSRSPGRLVVLWLMRLTVLPRLKTRGWRPKFWIQTIRSSLFCLFSLFICGILFIFHKTKIIMRRVFGSHVSLLTNTDFYFLSKIFEKYKNRVGYQLQIGFDLVTSIQF